MPDLFEMICFGISHVKERIFHGGNVFMLFLVYGKVGSGFMDHSFFRFVGFSFAHLGLGR